MTELSADKFITPKFKPANDSSRLALELMVDQLFESTLRTTSRGKAIFALCDVIGAVKHSEKGHLAWQLTEDKFYDAPYGRAIAEKLRNKLLEIGWLKIVQRGRRGLCQVYRVTDELDHSSIELEKHGMSSLVDVRAPTKVSASGNKRKGKRLRHSLFEPQISDEIAKIQLINEMMAQHPLQGAEAKVWSSCYRSFNEGRLDKGGRIYGKWQLVKPEVRLAMTIDGEPVAEIDIKGSFLYLGNHLSKIPIKLSPVSAYGTDLRL
ncbi:hypothetical protein LZA78_14875 [Sinirhodobacter sp. WL0062]|uniref:Replication protein n=1 Tax=Rhodobacter flavimaris TaxID=2907145 RepID=A0ABS8Z266_9RHOB|nr:hypothetical protein [Sinirhodobacter sp. WL0062]MCE5974771.1 hypothetical protein [Sinirhodobacter sp. WL0062]